MNKYRFYKILVVLLLVCNHTFSQTRRDYEHAMSLYMKFYNAEQYDSLYNMLTDWDKKHITLEKFIDVWTKDKWKHKMVSFEYKGPCDIEDTSIICFRVLTDEERHRVFSMSLDKNNKMYWHQIVYDTPSKKEQQRMENR